MNTIDFVEDVTKNALYSPIEARNRWQELIYSLREIEENGDEALNKIKAAYQDCLIEIPRKY